jgi:chromate reductase, NAD(P)H dehydrogenase (quinone)
MKVIALAGSNSKHSINKQLATYAVQQIADAAVTILDVNNYTIPMFSVDVEAEIGIPDAVMLFAKQIDDADVIVLSLAEHNGAYNAAFKNLIDWTSRIKDRKLWGNKRMLLMATAPGARGGIDVLTAAKNRFPFMGAELIGTFSLPEFYNHFNAESGITNVEKAQELSALISLIH